ncbi:methionine--tRNA ligase [Bacteriovoracaceae bacterium]|nr:methionine--tRNA ligase [Bacteriovoracaceae bacterium]
MKNFYATTPIYYVNSKPHIGHAYTSILVDMIIRSYKLYDYNTYFLTGTDEHGDKIAKSAEENKVSSQEWADTNSQKFRDLLPLLKAENNDFIRTTDVRHIEVVQDILQKVYDKGDIYFDEYTGSYCFGCERFLAEDDLENGLCKDHGRAPEVITEKNYFFKMSKYWNELKTYIESNEEFVIPQNYRSEVLGLLKMEPTDLCISRPKSRLTWGITLPFDENFVTYVWFDALINYVSALGGVEGELYQNYWKSAHHVIAKDILKPHCIYWQTMLLSAGIPLPKQVAIHGYWLIDDSKMSKSQGRTINPLEYIDQYGIDALRYYLLKGMNFGRDANFSHEDFVATINADLANNLGNLLSRTVGLLAKNFDGKTNSQVVASSDEAKNLVNLGNDLKSNLLNHLQKMDTHAYLFTIMNFSSEINKYIDHTKPWALAKDETKRDELAEVLNLSLQGILKCFVAIQSAIPEWAGNVLEHISINTGNNYQLKETIEKKPPGFMRIE